MEGLPQIQRKHTHKILAADLLTVIAHQHLEGLAHGKIYKVLHLLNGMYRNTKFFHSVLRTKK